MARRPLSFILFLSFQLGVSLLCFGVNEDRPNRAFLVKNGNQYLLAWRQPTEVYQVQTYSTLAEALRYAEKNLQVHARPRPFSPDPLERVWFIENRDRAFILYWKDARVLEPGRLSFADRKEGDFFYTAFRTGSYSRSVFGHSLILVR